MMSKADRERAKLAKQYSKSSRDKVLATLALCEEFQKEQEVKASNSESDLSKKVDDDNDQQQALLNQYKNKFIGFLKSPIRSKTKKTIAINVNSGFPILDDVISSEASLQIALKCQLFECWCIQQNKKFPNELCNEMFDIVVTSSNVQLVEDAASCLHNLIHNNFTVWIPSIKHIKDAICFYGGNIVVIDNNKDANNNVTNSISLVPQELQLKDPYVITSSISLPAWVSIIGEAFSSAISNKSFSSVIGEKDILDILEMSLKLSCDQLINLFCQSEICHLFDVLLTYCTEIDSTQQPGDAGTNFNEDLAHVFVSAVNYPLYSEFHVMALISLISHTPKNRKILQLVCDQYLKRFFHLSQENSNILCKYDENRTLYDNIDDILVTCLESIESDGDNSDEIWRIPNILLSFIVISLHAYYAMYLLWTEKEKEDFITNIDDLKPHLKRRRTHDIISKIDILLGEIEDGPQFDIISSPTSV